MFNNIMHIIASYIRHIVGLAFTLKQTLLTETALFSICTMINQGLETAGCDYYDAFYLHEQSEY